MPDDYRYRLTFVGAAWMFEAAGSAYRSLVSGSFDHWHPLIYLGLAKAVAVLVLGIAISQRENKAWGAAVVVPGLYLAVCSVLLAWMTGDLLVSKMPVGAAVAQIQSAVILGFHVAFVFAMSRTAWVCYPAFNIPKHQRWRTLVRWGAPVAVALLTVDVLVLTRFYWG